MKKIIATAIAALCVGGVAQAQTTIDVPDFVNTTLSTGQLYTFDFAAGGNAGNELIEGSVSAIQGVTGGLIVLSNPSGAFVASDSFTAGTLDPTTGNAGYNFQFQNLAAGAYTMNVMFAPPAGDSNVEQVGFAASVESTYAAPEIDPASAVAGLTLLVGGLLVFRGRRTMTPTFA